MLFGQVFDSISETSAFPEGIGYVDFLVPAILVTTARQSALQAVLGLTDDMRNGALARFRSLPIWTGSVLVARGLSDLARTGVRLAMTLVLAAVLFGFSPAGASPALSAWRWWSGGVWDGCSSPWQAGCAGPRRCRRQAFWRCSR